jgi:hypothetical protein
MNIFIVFKNIAHDSYEPYKTFFSEKEAVEFAATHSHLDYQVLSGTVTLDPPCKPIDPAKYKACMEEVIIKYKDTLDRLK